VSLNFLVPLRAGTGLFSLKNFNSYIYDLCALGSAYTARLPAIHEKEWRIGHHTRHMVPGFSAGLSRPSLASMIRANAHVQRYQVDDFGAPP